MKTIKPITLSLVLCLILIGTVSAVTLGSGTYLNSSVSNTSIYISNDIQVNSVVIEDTNITLNNVVCTGAYTLGINKPSILFFEHVNEVVDSNTFCLEYTGFLSEGFPFRAGFLFLIAMGALITVSLIGAIVYKYALKLKMDPLVVISMIVSALIGIWIIAIFIDAVV